MKILKFASPYLKKKATKYLILASLCVAPLFILALSHLFLNIGNLEAIRISLMLVLVYFAVRWWDKYKAFKLGYEGEKNVTQHLKSTLSDDYLLINDVVLPPYDGNIDHIVLSPKGIFAIETKNHRGRITFYGDEWLIQNSRKKGGTSEREFNYQLGSPSAQVKNNAFRLKKCLDSLESLEQKRIWVQGIVVFPNKYAKLIPKEYPEHVEVTNLEELPSCIRNYDKGKYYSPDEIELIGKEILRRAEKE
jgi:hypothetical protein